MRFTRKLIIFALLLLSLTIWSCAVVAQDTTDTPDAEATAAPPSDTEITVESGGTVNIDTQPDAPLDVVLPERDETLRTVLIVGGGVVVVLLLPTLFGLLLLAYNHVPMPIQQLLYENRTRIVEAVDYGTDRLAEFSRTTPNTLDDTVADYIDREVDRQVAEKIAAWEAARQGAPPSATG